MIGPIVNSGGLFLGGIIGVIFADIFPERLKKALPSIFGVITLCLGATLVGKATALPAVTISLILGTMVGEIMYAEALLQKVLRAIFGLLKSKRMGDENFSLMVITLVAAFCFGSMGFLGAFHEGLTGNPDILLTKAALDMFTGVVFGSFMGFSVSLIAVPQFVILALIYMGATTIAPLMTPAMLNDFTACGGVIFVATGLRMCDIKIFPVINMLPAMGIVLPLSHLWELYFPFK